MRHLLNALCKFIFPSRRTKRKATVYLEALESRLLLAAPQSPVMIDSIQFTESSTVVNWESVENATRYEMWFSTAGFDPAAFNRTGGLVSDNFTNDTFFSTAGYNNAPTFSPEANPGSRFRVWVRALNDDGNGPWSSAEAFRLPGTPKEKPDLTVEGRSFYQPGDELQVSWESLVETQRADTHEIWVSRDGQRIIDIEQEGSTFTSSELAAGVYQFWVRGESPDLTGVWSDSLTIAVGAQQPQVTGPEQNMAAARPEITWSAGVEGEAYQLWVQGDDGVVINETEINGTSFTPDNNLSDGVYSAWVRQVPVNGQPLPWSSRYQFAVGQSSLPEIPTLQVAENTLDDQFEDFRAFFSWDQAANAVRFELFISDRLNGNLILQDDQLSGTEFATPILEAGNRRAWLRSIGSNGELSLWSDPIDFGVATDGRILVGY